MAKAGGTPPAFFFVPFEMANILKAGAGIFMLIFCTILSSFSGRDGSGNWNVKRDSSDVHSDSIFMQVDSILTIARSYLGTPYKYGGKGPSQFDCSGYTHYIYKQFEVELPATSRSQAHEGSQIILDSARSGDLIFFTSPRSGTSVGHVGIITRNDSTGTYFIHSSSRRGVVEDRLEGYYEKRYLETRRVITY